jgi:hypothetical protein
LRPIGDLLLWFENLKSGPNFCATFFKSIDCVLILTKIGFGQILGDFFASSSGHPGHICPKPLALTRENKYIGIAR